MMMKKFNMFAVEREYFHQVYHLVVFNRFIQLLLGFDYEIIGGGILDSLIAGNANHEEELTCTAQLGSADPNARKRELALVQQNKSYRDATHTAGTLEQKKRIGLKFSEKLRRELELTILKKSIGDGGSC